MERNEIYQGHVVVVEAKNGNSSHAPFLLSPQRGDQQRFTLELD